MLASKPCLLNSWDLPSRVVNHPVLVRQSINDNPDGVHHPRYRREVQRIPYWLNDLSDDLFHNRLSQVDHRALYVTVSRLSIQTKGAVNKILAGRILEIDWIAGERTLGVSMLPRITPRPQRISARISTYRWIIHTGTEVVEPGLGVEPPPLEPVRVAEGASRQVWSLRNS
jgi:hypothetical protein